MSESADYDPGPWTGHDFKDARKSYDSHVGRSYADATAAGKSDKDVLEPSLKTQSTAPLLICCDITGSMGEWPAVMFSKLPYLEHEGKTMYLGKDMEIAWLAVGDAYCDDYPLQARPFTKGTDLEKRLKELVIVGGGGGQTTESYELAGLYLARKVEMPKAVSPILIMIGDEAPYDFVNEDQARDIAKVKLQGRLSTKDLFEELKERYAVYLIRKPYQPTGDNSMSPIDKRIHAQWAELVGEDHIAYLPEAQRVVDVIFGILAKESGRIDEFRKELEDRQTKDQVKTVYKSLRTIHALPGASQKKLPGRSTMHKPGGGKKSGDLL